MNKFLAGAAAAAAMTFVAAGSANAAIIIDITTGNAGVIGAGPYGTASITRNSATSASIIFSSNISGATYDYLFVDGGSVAVNVNAASWTLGPVTFSNSLLVSGGFSAPVAAVGGADGGAGNEDGFGSFNQSINAKGASGAPSTSISFDLTGIGTNWLTDADVLTPNGSGYLVAAHIATFADPATNAAGAINTGFAVNVAAVPEPGTWTLLIAGFGLIGFALRRRPAAKGAYA